MEGLGEANSPIASVQKDWPTFTGHPGYFDRADHFQIILNPFFMPAYDNLIEALADLQARGYEHDFNLGNEALLCPALATSYGPNDFAVKELHRFEGMTAPDDSTVLYAIETSTGVRGTLVSAYGIYADTQVSEVMQKLRAAYRN